MTRKGWVTFAAVSVVWGMPYLFIKIAVDEGVSPAFLSFFRVALAAVLLLPFAWRSGALHGLRAKAGPIAAFAVLEIVVPFPLIAFGEQHVASSLAAIIVAALPLTIAMLAIRFDDEERVHGARLAGLFIGLAGVVVLFGIDVAGDMDELIGALCVLLATVSYAGGPLVVKRHLSSVGDPLGPVAVAMGFAALLLLPAAVFSAPSEMPSGDAIAALVVLGLVCTALAFLLYFTLITEVGPSRASVITYINPVVAVALGVTLLGESVTAGAVAGLLLILAGSWLSTGGRPPAGLGAVVTRLRRRRPPEKELGADLRCAPARVQA
jgi:drug/metabolite transporter (DMT)-like permease